MAQDAAEPLDQALETAKATYDSGDYVTARRLLLALAERGDAGSQLDIGLLMIQGKGGPVERDNGEDWIAKAAAQDHPVANRIMGQIALAQPQAPGADASARQYLRRATELDDIPATYLLGELLLKGPDAEEALALITRAAEGGHTGAQYRLSELLSQGKFAPVDLNAAFGWLTKAADAGLPEAQYQLARSFDSGAIKPAQGDGTVLALDWYRRAAENGHVLAQRTMGVRHLGGEGVAQNTQEAIRWLRSAAEKGDAGAQFNLGLIYADGMGIPSDPAQALPYFIAASDRGVRQASYRAAKILEEDQGVPMDINRSFALYLRANEQGSDRATQRLGQLAAANFLGGRAAPHDAVPWVLFSARQGDAEALPWLEKQAEGEVRQAMHALGAYYYETPEGASGPRDAELAVQWFTRAAEADLPESQLALARMISLGVGTDNDYIAAHKWFNVAAARGLSEAAPLRDALTDLMTPDQVAEAQELATAFFEAIRNAPPPIRTEGE
ncbi:tetratricopeptide repeat protein [Marinovum sp. KMM 9879]